MSLTSSRHRSLLALISAAPLLFACVPPENETVEARVSVIDRSRSALTASGITALDGVYAATCDGHAADEPWSVGVNGNTSLAHTALSVRKNDGNCALTLKKIVVGGSTFAADPGIAFATAYAPSASAFRDVALDAVDFYGNAKIDSTAFAADFTITVLVNADANDATAATKQGAFATHSSTVTASSVPAPDYGVSLASFTLAMDVANIVVLTDGYAQLTAGGVLGQSYAVHLGTLSAASTQEQIAAAYAAATSKGLLSSLTSLQIPHGEFALTGVDLTASGAVRTVILRNTEAETGIVSYQLIAITFTKA